MIVFLIDSGIGRALLGTIIDYSEISPARTVLDMDALGLEGGGLRLVSRAHVDICRRIATSDLHTPLIT
jgi:hypothetical protein